MTLEEFNQAPPADAEALLRICASVPDWARQIVAARPFSARDQLLALAADLARRWGPEQIAQALAQHPRIGERPSGQAAHDSHSRREQGQVDNEDAHLSAALREGNRRYEQRFNQLFLIRAAGRSGQEILAQLYQRLEHTPEQEQLETARQLREIALLRLQGEIS